ncbi:MAG: transglycosylase family protein [Gemmatimonadales bacterium]
MPVPVHTVGAVVAAAALAAGPVLGLAEPPTPAVAPAAFTCEVHVSTSDAATGASAGTEQASDQLSPADAAKLLAQARELLSAVSVTTGDTRAAALNSGLRGLGITPAVTAGWQQAAHDLADTTLATMAGDPAAGRVAVALAAAGFSPTPADLRTSSLAPPAATPGPAATALSTPAPTADASDDPTNPGAASGGTSNAASGADAVQPAAPVRSVSADRSGQGLVAGAFAAAIAALPRADTAQACAVTSGPAGAAGGTGADQSTGGSDWSAQTDQLLAQLGSSTDPQAGRLADAISRARIGSSVADRPRQQRDTTGPFTTDDASSADSDASTDVGSTTPTAPATTTAAAAPATPAPTPTGAADSVPSTAPATQSWQNQAQLLADQLRTAGSDPTARELAAQLAAQGITAGGASSAGTTSSSTTSTSSDGAARETSSDTADDDATAEDTTDEDTTDEDTRGDDENTNGGDSTTASSPAPTSLPTAGSDHGQLQETSTPTPPSTTSAAPADGTWDQLASCESSGNWSIDTGNGYSGGLQFDAATWQAYGGTDYAPTAAQATKEQQIAVAEKLRAARGGYSAWPACSRKVLTKEERNMGR